MLASRPLLYKLEHASVLQHYDCDMPYGKYSRVAQISFALPLCRWDKSVVGKRKAGPLVNHCNYFILACSWFSSSWKSENAKFVQKPEATYTSASASVFVASDSVHFHCTCHSMSVSLSIMFEQPSLKTHGRHRPSCQLSHWSTLKLVAWCECVRLSAIRCGAPQHHLSLACSCRHSAGTIMDVMPPDITASLVLHVSLRFAGQAIT